METADGDRVFVADLPPERAWLGEANMMRFRRRPATDNTGLTGDELAVLFVAQANGLCGNTTAARARPRGQDDRSRGGGIRRRSERVLDWKSGFLRRRILGFFPTSGGPGLDRCEPFAKAALNEVSVGRDQLIFARKVFVDPVCGLVGGLEVADVSEQLLTHRCGLVWTQNGPSRTDGFLPTRESRRRRRPFLSRFGWSQSRGYAVPVSGVGFVGCIRLRAFGKVRGVEILFSRNAHEGEERIASRVGERRSHPTRCRSLGDRADRPFRRQPLS